MWEFSADIFWGQFKYICHIYRTKKLSIEQNDQIWPKIGIFGHFGPGLAGSFGILLMVWLVVVVPGLYLARHLFTLQLSIAAAAKKQ